MKFCGKTEATETQVKKVKRTRVRKTGRKLLQMARRRRDVLLGGERRGLPHLRLRLASRSTKRPIS